MRTSIRQGFDIAKRHVKEVGIMWLIMLGIKLTCSRVRKKGEMAMEKSKPSITRSTLISTQGLSKTYHLGKASQVAALKLLDLNVPSNSIFGFLGPNGAGKSTTIKLLLGLARPTEGSATIFGHDIVRDSLEIRKRVGYLAQAPRCNDHMTARETLRFKARFCYSGPKAEIEAGAAVLRERLEDGGRRARGTELESLKKATPKPASR